MALVAGSPRQKSSSPSDFVVDDLGKLAPEESGRVSCTSSSSVSWIEHSRAVAAVRFKNRSLAGLDWLESRLSDISFDRTG